MSASDESALELCRLHIDTLMVEREAARDFVRAWDVWRTLEREDDGSHDNITVDEIEAWHALLDAREKVTR